jgi:hypothetical protein
MMVLGKRCMAFGGQGMTDWHHHMDWHHKHRKGLVAWFFLSFWPKGFVT